MAEVTYSESVVVAADIERAFAYRLDFRNLPAYNPNVSNLRRVDGGTSLADAEYRFDLTLPGAVEAVEVPLRIVDANAPKLFTYETGPGWMAKGVCAFDARGDETEITLTYTLEFEGDIDEATTAMLESSGREQSRLELDNIKRVLES
jgi:hypothetical protein